MLKNSRARKVIAATIAAAVLAGTLAGCSKEPASTNTASTQSGTVSGDSTTEAQVEKLSIAIQQSPIVEDYDTNYYTKMIEDNNKVDLSFVILPTDTNDAKTKMSLMVTSNSKLPDIINMDLGAPVVYDYASKGVIVNMNEYYDNPELSKNFNAIPEETREFIRKNMKAADGNIYSVSRYGDWTWNTGSLRGWINQKWLDKVGMSAPKTTDDLYNVLKAFAEKDPNGNGKKDEIGMVGSKDGWSQRPLDFIMNAFIYANRDKQYMVVENGKIIPAFTQEEWKEGLTFIKKLIDEKLFSPLSFTQDQTQLKALINQKGGVAGIVPSGSYSVFKYEFLEADMALLEPLTGPKGASYTPYNPIIPAQTWFITKDCKNPEKAYSVGDYLLGFEPSYTSRFGEKGVEWSDDPVEAKKWVNRFEEEGYETKFFSMDPEFWGNPQNKCWADIGPMYRDMQYDMAEGIYLREEGLAPNQAPDPTPLYGKLYPPKFPEEFITVLNYTPEELEEISTTKATIDQYVTDSAVAFVTGSMPLSNWEGYLSELDKMGLTNYIEAVQVAFDRSK